MLGEWTSPPLYARRALRAGGLMSRLPCAGATAGATVAALAVLAAVRGSSGPEGDHPSTEPGNGAIHATNVASSSAPRRKTAPITKVGLWPLPVRST
jgi:hypothetical protein